MKEENIQPLISVIVPIYRVEAYLRTCLDSLCNQSLTNIEVILVDDASPDSCGDICEESMAFRDWSAVSGRVSYCLKRPASRKRPCSLRCLTP